MGAGGPDARAIVGITAGPGADTHFVNAQTINAGGEQEDTAVPLVVFLDGQPGALATLPDGPAGLTVTFTHLPGPGSATTPHTTSNPPDIGTGLAARPPADVSTGPPAAPGP